MFNSLVQDPEFQKTILFKTFQSDPLGFIDVGSLWGIHDIVHPIASLVHALCFEPGRQAFENLTAQYAIDDVFSKVDIQQVAVSDQISDGEKLYVTKHPNTSSLLRPSRNFIDRYNASALQVEKTRSVPTTTLDAAIYGNELPQNMLGEFLKLDTQGTEYDVLKGAHNLLNDRCLGIWCETEFFKVYENQKTYSDIETLLQDYGLSVYGLYPNYCSTKALDRRRCETEERLMWADVLFFKDPLDPRNFGRSFSDRDIQVLILFACLTRFYDFALELVRNCYQEGSIRFALESLVDILAENDKNQSLREFNQFYNDYDPHDKEAYLLYRKFIDKHRFNSTVDYVL